MVQALTVPLGGPLSYSRVPAMAEVAASIRHRMVSIDSEAIRICGFMMTSLWSLGCGDGRSSSGAGLHYAKSYARVGSGTIPTSEFSFGSGTLPATRLIGTSESRAALGTLPLVG